MKRKVADGRGVHGAYGCRLEWNEVSEEFCAFCYFGVLPIATGQGLRERFWREKSACFGSDFQLGRKGSKDRVNGMERKVTESSEWSEPDEVD